MRTTSSSFLYSLQDCNPLWHCCRVSLHFLLFFLQNHHLFSFVSLLSSFLEKMYVSIVILWVECLSWADCRRLLLFKSLRVIVAFFVSKRVSSKSRSSNHYDNEVLQSSLQITGVLVSFGYFERSWNTMAFGVRWEIEMCCKRQEITNYDPRLSLLPPSSIAK